MQATSALKVKIEAGGDGAVGHVGLHALAACRAIVRRQRTEEP